MLLSSFASNSVFFSAYFHYTQWVLLIQVRLFVIPVLFSYTDYSYTPTILIRWLFLYVDYSDTLTILIRWLFVIPRLFWYVDYSHMLSNTQSVHSSTRSIFISGLFVWLVCFHLFIRPRFFVKKKLPNLIWPYSLSLKINKIMIWLIVIFQC